VPASMVSENEVNKDTILQGIKRAKTFPDSLKWCERMIAFDPEDKSYSGEEDKDGVFLKRLPLTVGDTWAYGKTDSGITSSGRYYVTGMETITAGGRTLNAMRLDQMGSSRRVAQRGRLGPGSALRLDDSKCLKRNDPCFY
jgi:hypothetical protein